MQAGAWRLRHFRSVDFLLPAGIAQPGYGQGKIPDLETGLNIRGQFDSVQAFVTTIHDSVAFSAYQVVMTARIGIKPCLGPGIADPGYDAEPDKSLQHPVNRCPGNILHDPSDRIIDMVCRGMVGAGGQRLKDNPPLDGKRHPLLAKDAFQILHLFMYEPFPLHIWY
jgi:hypothetical protein